MSELSSNTSIAKLRRQALGRRGVTPAKHTKHLLLIDEVPDIFPKSAKMKMIEYKYHIKLEIVLFDGSLDDVVRYLNNEVDRSTISKWRTKYHGYMQLKHELLQD